MTFELGAREVIVVSLQGEEQNDQDKGAGEMRSNSGRVARCLIAAALCAAVRALEASADAIVEQNQLQAEPKEDGSWLHWWTYDGISGEFGFATADLSLS